MWRTKKQFKANLQFLKLEQFQKFPLGSNNLALISYVSHVITDQLNRIQKDFIWN